ncbi:MAG: serine hydrolase domain-containing protein [Phycisphaerales bacterium]
MLKWLLVLVALIVVARAAKAAAFALRPDPARCAEPRQPQPAAEPGRAGPRDLSGILEPIRAGAKVPAMAGALVSGGKVVAIGATGVRKEGEGARATTSDLWHLGSNTKAMTAAMIATLVEDGTLRWESTVGEVFKDVDMQEGWRPVTLRELLTNRGGAPANLDADGLWGRLWQFKGTPREARMELVRGVLKRPPGKPGVYTYSNGGFAIAGAMAEEAAGRAWEDLMRERLFLPLRMPSAGFGAPGRPEVPDQPRGHTAAGKAVEPSPSADNPVAIGPAGIVHCSLEDWARYISMHLAGLRGGSGFLKSETFRMLHEPAAGPGSEQYAMGWGLGTRPWAKGDKAPDGSAPRGTVLTHSGSNTMWFAVVWIAPEKDFAVLVVCNQGGSRAAKACDEAVGAIIKFRDEMSRESKPPAGP